MNKKFPVVEVSGTHEDVGRAIGMQMGEQIRKIVNEVKVEIKNYPKYLEKTKPYYDITRKVFPQLTLEMEAIAEAAGVLKEDYFFINNREVYDAAETLDKKDAVGLVKPEMSKRDMAALLSDTKNKEYPICRAGETVGSLVFQPAEGKVDICYGHPCDGKFNTYEI